jgi:hypothetical protein
MFEEYVMTEVIEAEFATLKNRLTSIQNFNDLLTIHNSFLDTITDRILLDSTKLLFSLNQMFR